MENNRHYSLGYSSCPNDTFIFKAMARNLIDMKGYGFDIVLEDVETLNQNAEIQKYDITKLSFAALGNLLDRYALLKSGSALGMGCGPMIIARPGSTLEKSEKPVIAFPGMGTTAFLLFQFFMADRFKGLAFDVRPMPFEKIMPAVIEKKADFGVIIHEGRFVYPNLGLSMIADLGQWWEDHTSLPIPLGCIAIKREISPSIAFDVQTLIKKSIDHAFLHPKAAYDYIRTHAQELDEAVIRQHIELYVNDFSKDLGKDGENAVRTFFEKGRQAGLIKNSDLPLFAC